MKTYPTATAARVLFWCGIAVCVVSATSIAIAEAFMPDNAAGRHGVIVFYRAFGPGILFWACLATGARTYLRCESEQRRGATEAASVTP